MSPPIKTVTVIGASGSAGKPIVASLLENGFQVSALTRNASTSTFPPGVTVHETDYSFSSLTTLFKDQDAIVSTLATFSTSTQRTIIDAAIATGVKRFLPSEYGVDTSLPQLAEFLPAAAKKQEMVQYLKSQEDKGLSWTAVIVGSFFDWTFSHRGFLGWDLPARKVTIYDDGKTEYEATNVAQIGRAVAAILSAEHLEETKNEYVYINSFTVTQNELLGILEDIVSENSGKAFAISHMTTKESASIGKKKFEEAKKNAKDGEVVMAGSLETVTAALYDYGGLNHYSKGKGLWNEKLSLPKEDLEETLRDIVAKYGAKSQ